MSNKNTQVSKLKKKCICTIKKQQQKKTKKKQTNKKNHNDKGY